MTPIDDELRSALSSRSGDVQLSPDFLDGVERRARGLRRRRAVASVAGTAIAVSALGVGGPMLASTLTSSPTDRAPVASAPPSVLVDADRYALDPAVPWAYRGDPQVQQDMHATTRREWATAHDVDEERLQLLPLFGQVYEPSATAELVFLAKVDDDPAQAWYGVARSSESGPELLVDERLRPDQDFLALALPGDEVARLLVVTSPEAGAAQYGSDAASEWRDLAALEDGVLTGPLDGDPGTDRVRVLSPSGTVLFEQGAPDAPGPAPGGEGPGTETPVEVDPAPYALDLADPWAYRGPAELTQHPDLGTQDQRLFVAGGAGRGDGSWSDRPLLAVERPDGLSVLAVLHTRGDEALVTTTWQRQDEAPQQVEQAVADGQLVVQAPLLQSDGSLVLVALAAPEVGAVEVDVAGAEQLSNEEGFSVWAVPALEGPGSLFLYSGGDGLLFHTEPARTDPPMPRG